MCNKKVKNISKYEKIYAFVRCVPNGKVATYGQISSLVDKCTPRMVGYAMANLPFDSTVPWHRIVNSKGEISIRSNGKKCSSQKQLLENEGIIFNNKESIDLKTYRWKNTLSSDDYSLFFQKY